MKQNNEERQLTKAEMEIMNVLWERGEGKPDIYYVNDICKLFNVSMDEMVYGNAMYIILK